VRSADHGAAANQPHRHGLLVVGLNPQADGGRFQKVDGEAFPAWAAMLQYLADSELGRCADGFKTYADVFLEL
jgi:hypothetical protein